MKGLPIPKSFPPIPSSLVIVHVVPFYYVWELDLGFGWVVAAAVGSVGVWGVWVGPGMMILVLLF
jgi:hypothetical protein